MLRLGRGGLNRWLALGINHEIQIGFGHLDGEPLSNRKHQFDKLKRRIPNHLPSPALNVVCEVMQPRQPNLPSFNTEIERD